MIEIMNAFIDLINSQYFFEIIHLWDIYYKFIIYRNASDTSLKQVFR